MSDITVREYTNEYGLKDKITKDQLKHHKLKPVRQQERLRN